MEVHVEWPYEAVTEHHALRIWAEKVKLVRVLQPHPLSQTQMANYVLLPLVLVGFADLGKHVGDRNRGRQAFPPGQLHRRGKNRR